MAQYERRLPHIQPENRYLFLTWRLYGSPPRHVRYDPYTSEGQAFVAHDRELAADRKGPTWLEDERIAEIVANAVRHGADERRFYDLHAWVVMPNHVHILILPLVAASTITQWLK